MVGENKRKLPRSSKVYLDYDLLCSDAYWELNGNELRVFTVFYMKRRVAGKKEARKMKVRVGTVKNDGQIVFTYAEAESYGISIRQFQRALDKLIGVGFIDIAIPGGMKRETKYSISERWKKYGTPEFEHKERKKRKNYIQGRGTRF